MRGFKNILLAALFLALIAGLTVHAHAQASDRVLVLVAVPPLKTVVEAVGGDRVEVKSILPAGADPHSYEPAAQELLSLVSNASLIVMTGPHHLPVEERLGELAEEGLLRVPILDYRDYLDYGLRILSIPDTGAPNPHGYAYSITGLRAIAKACAAELSRIDPKNSDYYEERLRSYLGKLSSLEERIRRMGVEGVRVVLGGPALQYLAEDLGLRVEGMILKAHGAEPTPEDVTNAVRAVRDKRVELVVLSDLELKDNPELARMLEENGVRYVVVPLLEVSDQPELAPLLAAALLKSNVQDYGGSATSLLELIAFPSLLANLILLLFLILLVMKVRRGG